jgi:hypothetical protein
MSRINQDFKIFANLGKFVREWFRMKNLIKFVPRYSCQDDFPSNSYLLFQNLKNLVLNLLGIQLQMSLFSAVCARSID